TEARARPVRRAAVVRDAEQRDIQVRQRLCRGQQHEGGDLSEPRRHERIAWLLRRHGYSFARRPETASTRRSISWGAVYTEKLARLVPTTPSVRMRGIAQ